MTYAGFFKISTALTCATMVSGCMDTQRLGDVARAPFSVFGGGADATLVSAPGAQSDIGSSFQGTQTPVMEGLMSRKSVLQGGAYAQVADAVLATNTGEEETAQRTALLTSEARATHWVPALEDNISLTSLNYVTVEETFDGASNPSKSDFAKADVAVAAVALSQDTNDRVMAALDLYVTVQGARARAEVNAEAMGQMTHFVNVMERQVQDGVSEDADLQGVLLKRAEMQADLALDRGTAETALAALNAMVATPLNGVSGLSTVGKAGPADQPLMVMKAQAEAQRALADDISAGNSSELQVIFDPGDTGSDAAMTRMVQTQDNAAQTLDALKAKLAKLHEEHAWTEVLADQAATNYTFNPGQEIADDQSVPDLVAIFDTKISTARDVITLRHDIARVELQIAAMMGALVDGARI